MIIKKMRVKDGPDFCFCCGHMLVEEEYVLNLGSPGSTFEFCRNCLKQISVRSTKVLNAGQSQKAVKKPKIRKSVSCPGCGGNPCVCPLPDGPDEGLHNLYRLTN